MGLFNTILLILFTGVVGVILVKRQGLSFYFNLRQSLSSRKDPGESLLHGFFIFLGGVLLITPGLVTDLWGFLMLLPFSRALLVSLCKKIIEHKVKTGDFKIYHESYGSSKAERGFDDFPEVQFRHFKYRVKSDLEDSAYHRQDEFFYKDEEDRPKIIDLNERKKIRLEILLKF